MPSFSLSGCALTVLALAAGCLKSPSAGVKASPYTQRDVHNLVEAKLDEQTDRAEGMDRWEAFKQGRYQTAGDIAAARSDLRLERARWAEAQALIGAGPMDLENCLAFSLEFNDTIQARRAGIRAVGGDELVTRSRFLPTLTYRLHHERADVTGGSSTNDTHHALLLSQTLLEFGKDNAADIVLRESQRETLFDYEDTVRTVLRDIRKRFFTVLLRNQQLRERERSLEEFRTRYDQMVGLEEARRVLEVDVLTARLNVLNEEANINSLQREIVRQRIDLLHLMGFPVGLTELAVAGETEAFDMPLEACVEQALLRSSAIAQSRAELSEQARRVHELRWEYAPALDMRAGWKDERSVAGLSVETTDDVYSLSAFAEGHADAFDGQMEADIDLLAEEEEGWFVDLSMELPVFQGLERRGNYRREQALLAQARHKLRDLIDSVESDVRKAYQTVLEQRKQVEILGETVRISKERLRVQEQLKELGRISDNELETFRERYFDDQDKFFARQISLVEAQEDLRHEMRMFEPIELTGE